MKTIAREYLSEQDSKSPARLRDGQLAVKPPAPGKPVDPEQHEDQFKCNSCGETFDSEDEAVTLYECGDCGQVFSAEDAGGNRCPDCNKFAAKFTDMGCPSCSEGELEEVQKPAREKPEVKPAVPPPTPDRTTAEPEPAKLRGKCDPPFAWQSKVALRMIESQLDAPDSALLLYLRLTWIASDKTTRLHNGNEFSISHAALARLTGFSVATVKRRLSDLVGLRLIDVHTEKLKTPCSIRLLRIYEVKSEK